MLDISGKKEEILDYLILLPKIKKKRKITPIYFSVLNNDESPIHKLLALKIEINPFYGENNETILHDTIYRNKIDIIRLLFI